MDKNKIKQKSEEASEMFNECASQTINPKLKAIFGIGALIATIVAAVLDIWPN